MFLPLDTVMFTVQTSGDMSSERYLGLRILSTEISTLLSGGISATSATRGRMRSVLPLTVTVRFSAALSPRLKSLNDVKSGIRQ